MALSSHDEAYTIPSEEAARLSLRTMQILMHEAGACDTVDPLAGAYFVAAATSARASSQTWASSTTARGSLSLRSSLREQQ